MACGVYSLPTQSSSRMAEARASDLLRRCRALLGTFVEVTAPTEAQMAIDAAFQAVAHVHARMSFHEETSDLGLLRRSPLGKPVKLDRHTVAVLALARQLHDESDGLFDVAVGARLAAIGFLPRPPGVDLRRMAGGTRHLEILDPEHVICHKPMLVDLGGIAKGYAVDCAVAVLAQAGVGRAVVNAGGDLRVIGTETIHLRTASGAIGHAIEIADCALATSSNLHLRRRVRGRETVPHLDGRRAPVLAAGATTVLARQCAIADAMTKIAMADPARATAMLADLGGEIVATETWELAA